jgi:hypothetical protein
MTLSVVGGAAEACFCQAQESSAILGLVNDRLQLSTECFLALMQERHSPTQLIDRQQSFPIGVKKSFDPFANMGQLSLQTLLPFSGGIAGARCYQPTIKFLVYQSWLFQQADHLGPDDRIEGARPLCAILSIAIIRPRAQIEDGLILRIDGPNDQARTCFQSDDLSLNRRRR